MKTIETKEPYLHILNTQGNVYEEFLPDQVLTHKNLNKIVNYFEDQDRLSRIYLTGVGVGCGLNIVSFSTKHIEIGQGVGITTDGDIIKSETRRFQYYSTLSDKADYSLFRQEQQAEGELKVYELYEQEATGRPNDELPLASFSINESTALKDCIVIAYVETYTEDEGLCGGSGCDETGNKVFNNLKFLITHKNNKDKLIGSDTIYNNHDVLAYYDNLPDICIPRIILTKENTVTGLPIFEQYKKTFVLKDDLYLGISTIIRKFSQRINFQKYGVFTSEIATYIDTIFSDSDDENLQYRYDLLRDLVDTYREIKDLILHSKFECVPNIKSFPKHLLLGTPEPTTRLTTRHQFYPSPMVSENDENLIAIKTLCIKFFYQLKEFNIIDFESAQIKITPSKSYNAKLSERSIPYYYRSGKSLVNNWNPVSNKNRKSNYQLGYNTGNLKNLDCIKDPLNYSHLDKDFYRIEGHQGKNFVIALKNIIRKKQQYNLPFDVKAISIGYPINKISLDEDTCETKEYITLIQTWEEEFNCVANKAIDFFGRYQLSSTLGVNDTEVNLHTIEREEAEIDKSFLQGLEDIKLESLNVNFPLGNTKNIKIDKPAKREITTIKQGLTKGQKGQLALAQLAIGEGLPTRFSTLNIYKRSLSFLLQGIIKSINPENLTADYVAAEVVARFERLSNNQSFNVESDDFKLYIEIPARIISHLEIVKYRFIRQLQDVYVTERWTAFHSAFTDLCTEVERILLTLSATTDNDTFGNKVHDKMYEFLIHKIGGLCCLKEKFNWLKEQLDEIRLNLYKELILSKFVEQHPGLEHMAGVPKGGTFLMVYIGEQQVTLEDDEATVETFDRKVLLDFALPYMCKAECAPDTIVYSDIVDPVTLAIARKKFCLPSNSDQEDFIIEPERGVVTSPDGTAFIITTAEGYAFDPTKVPSELLGEPIQFLVDGKVPTIPIETVVYKLPDNVTASYTFVAWTDDGLVINLDVTHELEDLLYLQHTWKRANGSEIALGKNPTNILIITDETVFQETITLVIDVIGNPVPCKLVIPIDIDEEREIIEVGVDTASEICYNTQETSPTSETISVVPPDGVLTSPQQPVNGQSFIELFNGVYSLNPLFVPDALAGEPITFEVNGIPVEDFETRVYKIPGTITTNSEVISWDETGVNMKLTATHAFIDKSYLAYQWLDENDQIIATSSLANIHFDSFDGDINTTVRVRVRVRGTETELCTSSDFPLVISEIRPEITVSIPPALCWQEGVEPDLIDIVISDSATELTCLQQEEVGAEFLVGDPGAYQLKINAIPNELIGVPIIFEISGQQAASTIVYKVPENIEVGYSNAVWNGNTLVIDIESRHSLEEQISTIESYLSYSWTDRNNAIVLNTKNHINYEINTEDGSFEDEFTLEIKVKEELIESSCISPKEKVEITENRPNVTVTVVPEICHIQSETVGNPVTYPITVTPSSFSISSPDGTGFIEGTLGNYRINPEAVPEELLGQEIRFVADGEVKATTKVYRIPELVRTNINTANEVWVSGGLEIDLSSTILARSYYKYEWFMQRNGVDTLLDRVREPNRYLIPDTGDGVNVEVFLRISANTDGILCSQQTRKTTINRHRPISVSKDRFCIPDTPVVFRGISSEIGEVKSTNSALPSNVITKNGNKYVFNPDRVPESFWGLPLRFSVNGIIQSGVDIRVYKTPNKESIIQDVEASKWVQNGYEFVFTHDLINKDYFSYVVSLESGSEELEKVAPNTYFIPIDGDTINDKVMIKVLIPGVSCSEDKEIIIETTRPDEPVGRLDCSSPYGTRLNILGTQTLLNTIKTSYDRQSFENEITQRILDPLNNVILGIINARNLNSIVDSATRFINDLRKILMNDFYNSPTISQEFYRSFLEIDEVMELVVLEMLRCVDNGGDLITAVDIFFGDSKNRNQEYNEKPRHTIDNSYIGKYAPKVTTFKTKFDAVFGAIKKRR